MDYNGALCEGDERFFLSNVFMALVLARGKDGTLCLVNLWTDK